MCNRYLQCIEFLQMYNCCHCFEVSSFFSNHKHNFGYPWHLSFFVEQHHSINDSNALVRISTCLREKQPTLLISAKNRLSINTSISINRLKLLQTSPPLCRKGLSSLYCHCNLNPLQTSYFSKNHGNIQTYIWNSLRFCLAAQKCFPNINSVSVENFSWHEFKKAFGHHISFDCFSTTTGIDIL